MEDIGRALSRPLRMKIDVPIGNEPDSNMRNTSSSALEKIYLDIQLDEVLINLLSEER